ncbi:MAG: hypothetical protein K9L84_03415 [Candidatus Omnitrophica bacterium]|nr:hypothetical protein [Candidatus Omnitrophota bacterium]MCF7894087.1 hypothetical protein [Candidatus Omnitrophota bacterium]
MSLFARKNNSYFLKSTVAFFILILFLSLSFNLYAKDNQRQRMRDLKKIEYNISFNGIPSGYVIWRYLGKEVVGAKEVDVLQVESDTNILKFLDLVSSEKIYLDSNTHLPVRVKRNVKLFGDKEIIEENYNQEQGQVVITRKKGKNIVEEEIYEQAKPIHNILDLLYFFPQGINLGEKKGKWMTFNLPNQKVQIKFHSKRKVKVAGKVREAYFLVGKGAKRFNLWLSLDDRIPLRLDFISWLGKIIIRREKLDKKKPVD